MRFEIHKAMEVDAYMDGKSIGKIKVSDIGNGQWLRIPAADDFRKMQAAAKRDGIELRPNSGFRSFEHQKRLRDEWRRKSGLGIKSPRPARPGFSVHCRGEAVDIQRSHGDDPDGDGFTVIDDWLRMNAGKFNFFRMVPSELWHWEWILVVS